MGAVVLNEKISRAVSNMRGEGMDVAHIHLRYIWPLPRNLGDLLKGFGQVLVPEMNNGQLVSWPLPKRSPVGRVLRLLVASAWKCNSWPLVVHC